METELLAAHIKKNLDIYEFSASSFFLSGIIRPKKTFIEFIPNSTWKGTEFIDIAFMDKDYKHTLSEKVTAYLDLKPYKQRKYEKDIAERKEIFESTSLIDVSYDAIKIYQPVIDMESGDKLLFDTEAKILAENFSHEVWLATVPKDLRGTISNTPIILRYDPYEMFKAKEGVYQAEEGATAIPVTVVNKHRYPRWRYEDKNDIELPENILTFLEHLFPHEESRIYTYNWVRNAILNRCGTYLVLNAAKGIGKNIFVDMLKELVGSSNYGKAHRKFFDSGFNSILKDKRLILIDEHAINTDSKIDLLKDYINPEQNLEMKGIDADKAIETFNSFVICNNRATDIKIEQDDRRFSVIETTDVKLLEIMTEEEIDKLIKSFKDPEVINRIGNFFLANDHSATWGNETAYKGERFDYLVRVSLWEWQKHVVDAVLEGTGSFIAFRPLKKKYDASNAKSTLSKDKVIDFLLNYKDEKGSLGEWERQNDEWGILPRNNIKAVAEVDDL